MKIAVIGGTGLLGSSLVNNYKQQHSVRSFSRRHQQNVPKELNTLIDFNHLASELRIAWSNWTPDIIINTVAIVNVAQCENDYDLALEVNAAVAKELSLVASEVGAYFVQVSTDHFYQDDKLLHDENDNISLLNNYAKTKRIAEIETLHYVNTLVARTNIIGFRNNDKPSFFEWLLFALINKTPVHLFADYVTSPITTDDFAKILIQCYQKKLSGIYNIAARNCLSKYDFGVLLATALGEGLNTIQIATIQDTAGFSKRATTLGLDVKKIEDALSIQLPTVGAAVHQLVNIYREQKHEEIRSNFKETTNEC